MEVRPRYKKTEVGVIPDQWQICRFGDVCSVLRGGSPRPIQNYITDSADGINWIKIGDVGVGAKYIDTTAEKIIPAGASWSRYVKTGDFLLSNSMSFGRPYILRTEGCIHDGWLVVQNYHSNFDTEYLYYYLSAEAVLAQYTRYAAGSSVLNLNKDIVSNIRVAVPPLSEQRAIAAALSDVDALLDGLDRFIAKKRDLKQAAMQELLTGKIRLPGFHGEWEETTLGELGQFLKGSGVTKDQTRNGCLACVRYGELYTHHNDVIRAFFSWISQEVAATAVRLRKGDILFAGSGETKEEIGKCAAFISDAEAYAGGDIVILRPREANAVFLGYFLNTVSINRQKASRGQGDAVVHISSSALAAIRCRIPTLTEQTAIAEVLTEMDLELAGLKQRREKTRALKQAMMQELLTGRTRLV